MYRNMCGVNAVRGSLKAVSHYRLNIGSRSAVDETIHPPSPISFQIKPAGQTIHSPSPKTPSSIYNSATDNSRIHIYSRTGKPHPRIDQQSNGLSIYERYACYFIKLHQSPCFMQLRNRQLNIYHCHIFISLNRAIYKLTHYTRAYLPSLRTYQSGNNRIRPKPSFV